MQPRSPVQPGGRNLHPMNRFYAQFGRRALHMALKLLLLLLPILLVLAAFPALALYIG